MSKRRRASELMFGKKNALKYPVNVVAVLTGTGTATEGGVLTILASATATTVYATLDSGADTGTIVGTSGVIS